MSCIGIIGAGNIAETQYIPALKKLGATPVLIYDIDGNRAQYVAAKHKLKNVSRQELLTASDAVILATPPGHHSELLKEIIPHSKRVICEKPFVFRKSEAETLVTLAESSGCLLLVAHIKRIFPAMVLARQLVREMRPGALLKAGLFDGSRSSYKSHSGYTTQNPYGGVLLDSGSHALDCFYYVAGQSLTPEDCTIVQIKKDKAEPSHEFEAQLLIGHTEVTIRLSRYEALANKMNLYFEHMVLEVPFDLKPFVRITDAYGSRVVTAQTGIFNYISEAFRAELAILLSNEAPDLFHAGHFITLTSALEKLCFYS